MTKQYVLGADNGKTGCLVFLDTDTGKIEEIQWYPNDSAKRLYELIEKYKPVYTVLEKPFMGPGFKNVASTNFEILGRYAQVLDMLDLKYDAIRAVTWRAKLKIKAKGRQQQKEASIQTAAQLFSEEDYMKLHSEWKSINKELHKKEVHCTPNDNMCESALIAYYALQIWREQQ